MCLEKEIKKIVYLDRQQVSYQELKEVLWTGASVLLEVEGIERLYRDVKYKVKYNTTFLVPQTYGGLKDV